MLKLMLKLLLILTLLKIISRYQWYIDLVNNWYYITEEYGLTKEEKIDE